MSEYYIIGGFGILAAIVFGLWRLLTAKERFIKDASEKNRKQLEKQETDLKQQRENAPWN